MSELTLVWLQRSFQPMLLLVFVGFSWILIFNGLSRPASLSTNFPLSGPSTHFQQTTFAVSSFQLAQMVFNWFVGSFNRFSTGCVGSLFSTGFQLVVKQVFNELWSVGSGVFTRWQSLPDEDSKRQFFRLCSHSCGLGLSARGGDGGVEEEGHVEHLALQQQPCSLLHLLRGKWNFAFKIGLKCVLEPQEAWLIAPRRDLAAEGSCTRRRCASRTCTGCGSAPGSGAANSLEICFRQSNQGKMAFDLFGGQWVNISLNRTREVAVKQN